jgi:peptidoglycan/LPS O-acetylase OafA/YrhL
LFIVSAFFGRYLASFPYSPEHDYIGEASSHILASMIYSHQFIYQSLPLPNCVLWSLEIEVQFYILVPLLALVFTIRTRTFRRTVIAVIMLVFSGISFYGRDGFLVSNSLLGRLQEFLAGFLLVDLYLTEWKDAGALRYGWDLLSLVAWTGILFSDCLDKSAILVLPWLMLLAYLGAFRGVILSRVLSNPWVATIGGMCYTIYMYHYLLISVFGRVTLRLLTGAMWLDVALQFVIFSVITLAICSLLFLFFERPFMQPDWHKRVWAIAGCHWSLADQCLHSPQSTGGQARRSAR